jgi:ABC-2 type transport system ATP-binding protein
VREGLREICAEQGSALLITSHDMSDVERICERVVFLAHGRVVADGAPGDVVAAYGRDNLESVFLDLAARHDVSAAQQSDRP